MFDRRGRKVLREVWLHKSRTVLVVLAITVGIVGAGAVLNTWSLLRRVTRGEYRASNPAAATLRTENIDAALLARVRDLPAVADAQARRAVLCSARVQGSWRTALLFATSDLADIRIGIVKPESGAWPPADGAFAIEHSSVEFAGLAVGDSLALQFGEAPICVVPVTGIARDVGLAPGWMEHVVYGFVTPATLAQLGAPASFDQLQITLATGGGDRDAERRVAADVQRAVEATGRVVTHVEVPVPGRHLHAAQIDSLLFTQGAFGVLAILMSGILVVNLVAAMLAGQVREIGVMKAIGASGRQIAAMYLGLALVLGLVAAAIALPLAAILGIQYARFTADILNFDTAGFTIPASVIIVQLAAGLLLPVVAAAIPVARGGRVSVSEALRDLGIAGGRAAGNGGRWVRAGGVVGRPWLLSLRNAFRRRQRMALTLATLALGGAVFLGALNLRAAIRGSVDLLYSAQRFDVALRFAAPWPVERIETAIARVPGVAGVEAWGAARAAIALPGDLLGARFTLSAPPLDSKMLAPLQRGGRWLRAGDERALVVNRCLLSDEPSLAVGSHVTLILGGRRTAWEVVGIVDTGIAAAAYTSRATLASVLGESEVDRAVIAAAVDGAASHLDLIQRLRSALEGEGLAVQSSQIVQEGRAALEDHLLMVANFLGVMSQLMIVVGGLGLASTMSLAVLERTREIGVLRALGARHRTISTMVQVEGLVVAVLSWMLALPLSVPMSVILGRAFGRIMLPVPLELVPEGSGVALWLAVAVVVSIAACSWPAFRATRIPTATALAYE